MMACVVLLSACRDKESPEDDTQRLIPPLALAFSIPSGDVLYFNPETLQPIHGAQLNHWFVVAAETHSTTPLIAVAEAGSNRVAVFSLPLLESLGTIVLGGSPVAVDASVQGTEIYAATRNGSFWMVTPSSGEQDTLEIGLYPRRMAMRPPHRLYAWIACPTLSSVYVIDVVQRITIDTLHFSARPTDVEFSPDGLTAFVALSDPTGSVVELNAQTRETVAEYPVGIGPFDIALAGDSRYLGVADSTTGQLNVMNLDGDERWTARVDSGATRLRYSESANAWFVISSLGTSIYRFHMEQNGRLAPADTIPVTPTVSEIAIWE